MYSSLCYKHLTATGTHAPYGITECYLPPGRGDIPTLSTVSLVMLITFQSLSYISRFPPTFTSGLVNNIINHHHYHHYCATGNRGMGRLISCICDFVCVSAHTGKKKALAINTRLSSDIASSRLSASIDPKVKRSKLQVYQVQTRQA